ncbi:MAG: sulfite oxidase heme-binding subunit YedZ [Acetobacteraceae bacterium]
MAAQRRRKAPWRDRRGQFSWFKTAALVGCAAPASVVAFWLVTHQLGGRPVKATLLWLGLWTVRFILLALAITPFSQALAWPGLTVIRRMVGVTAAVYALAHLTLYVIDENLRLGFVAGEILRRFYLTIGFVALLGLAALAVTSFDAAVRRLGRSWTRLHRLAYPIAVLALLHFFIQSKAAVGEPTVMAGLFLWLMAWRAQPVGWRGRLWVWPALALASGLGTAAIEFAWYAIATGIDPWRVLAANETLRFGLRPAHWVTLVTFGLGVVLAIARAARNPLALPRRRSA